MDTTNAFVLGQMSILFLVAGATSVLTAATYYRAPASLLNFGVTIFFLIFAAVLFTASFLCFIV